MVNIPEGWAEVAQPSNIVYGDHVDYIFVSKSDPNEQLLIISDQCSGCILGVTPASLAPTGARSLRAISATEAGFADSGNARSLSTYWSGQGPNTLPAGYETEGLVIVGPAASSPAYAVVAVSVPASERSVATQILNSAYIPAQ
jgi:hypothetical protein